jgi:hypothetical protein
MSRTRYRYVTHTVWIFHACTKVIRDVRDRYITIEDALNILVTVVFMPLFGEVSMSRMDKGIVRDLCDRYIKIEHTLNVMVTGC